MLSIFGLVEFLDRGYSYPAKIYDEIHSKFLEIPGNSLEIFPCS